MRVVVDTNVLVDYLTGLAAARLELARDVRSGICLNTWMEVLVGARSEAEDAELRAFLGGFQLLPITNEVASRAVEVRRLRRIRLPDAIIWATALVESRLLVSRNTRDFPGDEPGVRVPYMI